MEDEVKECPHLNFKAQCNVTRLTDAEDSDVVIGYRMEVEVFCMDCHKPFAFVGLPGGYHPSQPTVSADEMSARLPIKPLC